MVQLRDLLAGAGLVRHHPIPDRRGLGRLWPCTGRASSTWPLVLTVLLTEPLLGRPNAELAAALAIPMLTFALGAAADRANRLGAGWGGPKRCFAALMLALSLPVLIQMRPMRIDHHGWQLVMALLAVNALFSPRRSSDGSTGRCSPA